MPAHRLTPEHHPRPPAEGTAAARGDLAATAAIELAVLAVLTGTPPPIAAAGASIPVADLLAAAERYQTAGRSALTGPSAAQHWHQVALEFPRPHTGADTVATQMAPRLRDAEAANVLTAWWYIRKTPQWRIRLQTRHPRRELPKLITGVLEELAAQQLISTWTIGIYEPETNAFGGPEGMATAHRFFHADSHHALQHITRTTHTRTTQTRSTEPTSRLSVLGDRETSLLVCTALLRGAGQDWHEQGDVWHRVAQMRPLPADVPPQRLPDLADKMRTLLALDTESTPELRDPHTRSWLAAARGAGHALGDLGRHGTLQRGLRDVLAHHVIFHWNRLGLTTTAQAVLAHTAVAIILNMPYDRHPSRPAADHVADP
jgi:thiopeptide-type bacteriocin biosynthesis protein